MSLKEYWSWVRLNFFIWLGDVIGLYNWEQVGSWEVSYLDDTKEPIVTFYEDKNHNMRKVVPNGRFIFLFFKTLKLYFYWQIKLYSLGELNEYMIKVEKDEVV